MNATQKAYLGFSHILGIGPYRFSLFVKRFGDTVSAYNAPDSDIKKILTPKIASQFIKTRASLDLDAISKEMENSGIHFITRDDKRYPQQLRNVKDCPIALYIKGDIDRYDFDHDLLISIVGSRKTTSYGQKLATMFAEELAEAGVVVVSGMALGIDGIAHKAALDKGGRTIAVLGCGVDIIYPSENTSLYHRILQNKGLVISEFPPQLTVLKGLFVSRNRIVSGLSKGVLVIEGRKNSGSLITARLAGEQGRDVFACPSPITSFLSEAPNLLLKDGAMVATSTSDILSFYRVPTGGNYTGTISENLDEIEKKILSHLMNESLSSDSLVELMGCPVYQILPTLTSLEMKGLIEINTEGKYDVKTTR